MNVAQLPTGNLYKCIALSGVALMVAAFYWPMQLGRELAKQVDLGVREVNDGVSSIVATDMIAPAPDEPLPPTPVPTSIPAILKSSSPRCDAAAEKCLKTQLALLVSFPEVASTAETDRAVWRAFFKSTNASLQAQREYIVELRLLPKGELAKLLSQHEPDAPAFNAETTREWLIAAEANTAARAHLARKLVLDTTSLWTVVDEVDRAYGYGDSGLIVGLGVAAAGFFGWWRRVQRWEDIVLRSQATQISSDKRMPRRVLRADPTNGDHNRHNGLSPRPKRIGRR